MKPFLFFFLLLFGVCMSALTQETEVLRGSIVDSIPARERRNAVGIHAGFPGFGLDYGRKLGNQLMLRGQINLMKLNINDLGYQFEDTKLLIDAEVNFLNIDALLDYHPFKNSSFRLTVGLGYFIDQVISSTVAFDGDLLFNDITYTPEQVGVIGLTNSWGAVAPYGGIGFGRAVPKGKFGFGFELGTYYGGKPKPTIIATGMLEDNVENEAQLRENLSEYRWLPVLKMRLAYKF